MFFLLIIMNNIEYKVIEKTNLKNIIPPKDHENPTLLRVDEDYNLVHPEIGKYIFSKDGEFIDNKIYGFDKY